MAKIVDFSARWKVAEFALFGSVLRDDFGPESDIDVLVTIAPDSRWTLIGHVRVQNELAELLGRRVDLVSRRDIERSLNHLRKKEILDSAEVICAA